MDKGEGKGEGKGETVQDDKALAYFFFNAAQLQLEKALEKRGHADIWRKDNLSLWRVVTSGSEMTWSTPAGQEFKTIDQVVDFLIALPKGGTREQFIRSAPSNIWEGLEVDTDIYNSGEWERAKVLKRITGRVYEIKVLENNKVTQVDLTKVRARWVNPRGNDVLRNTPSSTDRKKRATYISTSVLNNQQREFLRDEVIQLRRRRLRDICERGISLLEDAYDQVAQSIANYLEYANISLLEMEKSVDASKKTESRESVTESLVEYLSGPNADNKGWTVHFQIFFEGPKAGQCEVQFVRGSEVVTNIADMGKRLNATQYPLDETDDGWCYYRNVDIIDACELQLDKLCLFAHSCSTET